LLGGFLFGYFFGLISIYNFILKGGWLIVLAMQLPHIMQDYWRIASTTSQIFSAIWKARNVFVITI
jgi:hypothetical protein